MHIGLYADTHGLHHRDALNHLMHDLPPEQMRTIDNARRCEELGFDSMWFADHLFMPIESKSSHKANISGTRAYRPRHTMMDAAVTMAAVAASTRRLKLATSVLIAPYRPPLSDARQFATLDILSGGRLILGVGAGWMREEFDVVGRPFEHRGAITEECIEIYKRCWTEEIVEFHGEFYDFANLSMDPKPVQKPYPPLIFGGQSRAGARRAARLCDGFYPIFSNPQVGPHDLDHFLDEIRHEADRVGKDLSQFQLIALSSCRITAPDDPWLSTGKRRPNCSGTPEMILEDLAAFAEAGYSLMVFFQDCPSGTVDEFFERAQQVGEEIIPKAKEIQAGGEWMPVS